MTSLPDPARAPWWQRGIIYQVYPRSFQDASGDGVGDLRGVTARLEYLQGLGVDAVWLSPIFTSPMKDFGYDVADYEGVDPLFGSMADFDELLAQAHARGLKVMLDLVPNHSSDQHPWFVESRSGRESPKRDWYIWRDPAPDGGPPTNWTSFFGGSAWTLDETTGQYYLHQFLKEQPELNWANPAVRAAIAGAVRFWLKRGVDGFRVDVIWLLGKHQAFLDEPLAQEVSFLPGQQAHGRLRHIYTQDQPETHGFIHGLRQVLDEYSAPGQERVMVGEIYLPLDRLMTYYGPPEAPECHMPFNFLLLQLTDWTAESVRALVETYDAACVRAGGWPNWVLGNHDQSRFRSRLGPDLGRLAQTLLFTLRGTPTAYYGDEIGMADLAIPPERQQDPQGLNQPGVEGASRDPERTPMQWENGPGAGFTTGEPWLPLPDDLTGQTVADQQDDPASELSYFRALTSLRRAHPALSLGDYASAEGGHPEVYAYTRTHGEDRVLVLLNFADGVRTVIVPEGASLLLSSVGGTETKAPLAPHEARVLRLGSA